jgi:thiol-disulfide isomerase/thioredoxin
VVQFWATWCSPCIAEIPHLIELVEKYKSLGVEFIGVAAWENQKATPESNRAKIETLLTEKFPNINYRIGYTHSGTPTMVETWLSAAGQRGIPTSFIVGPDGRIAYVEYGGPPEQYLDKIAAGTWDGSLEKEEYLAEREKNLTRDQIMGATDETIGTFLKSGDYESAVNLILESAKKYPDYKTHYDFKRAKILIQNLGQIQKGIAALHAGVSGAQSVHPGTAHTVLSMLYLHENQSIGLKWALSTRPNFKVFFHSTVPSPNTVNTDSIIYVR